MDNKEDSGEMLVDSNVLNDNVTENISEVAEIEQKEDNSATMSDEENLKKKDPITILSVEVMPSTIVDQHGTVEAVQCDGAVNVNSVQQEAALETPNSNTNDVLNDCEAFQEAEGVVEETIHNEAEIVCNNQLTVEENNSEKLNDVDETNQNEVIMSKEEIDIVAKDTSIIESASLINDANISQDQNSTEIANISSDPSTEDMDLLDTTICSAINQSELSTTAQSTTGLSLLAQYGSDNDSDTESVVEVPLTSQDYRSKVVEIDSDSDSDSSGSDVEYLTNLRKVIEKRMEVDDDDENEDDDDENESGKKRKPKPKVKVKGEMLLDDLPPIQDLQITVAEDECIELGKIHSIVDQLVLVSALPNSVLLDLDTVLFLDKGQRVLGEVFDVMGQVADPIYCVRFNSNKQIGEKNISVNDTVYVAPKTQYTQFIILSSLIKLKGSDASWENDIEPPPRFLDYSDDEQEQLAKRQMRNKNRPVDNDDPEKRARTDSVEPQSSNSNASPATSYRKRYPSPGRRGGSHQQNNYGRPRHTQNGNQQNQYGNQQNQQQMNHHPSSWHSNYYPPPSYTVPPPNYNYGGYRNMPAQNYQQVPMYPMPMNYGQPPPQQYIGPAPNQHPVHPQMVPNVFHMRPPTMPGNYEPSPPGDQ